MHNTWLMARVYMVINVLAQSGWLIRPSKWLTMMNINCCGYAGHLDIGGV